MAKATLMARIGLDTKAFRRGMARVRRMTQAMVRGFKTSMNIMRGIAVGFGILGAGMLSAAKRAQEFNKQIGQVATLTDMSIGKMKKEVRALSSEFGLAKDELTKGLYDALSAGIPKENVFDFMRVASKAAVAGASTTAEAVDVLTTTLNAFKLPAEDAARVADVLFTTVRLGKTTLPEIAASFAQVAPLAKASGVEFEQVAAAIATLTKQGTPTAQAMTQIRGAIIAMNKELGDGWSQTMTLAEGMQEMRNRAGGSQIALKEMTGRVEGMLGILGLTGANAKGAAADFDAMTRSVGAADQAFGKMEDVNKLDKIFQSLNNIILQFGDEALSQLGPELDKALEAIRRFSQDGSLGKWATNAVIAFNTVIGTLSDIKTAIAAAAAFIGGFTGTKGGFKERVEAGKAAAAAISEANRNADKPVKVKADTTQGATGAGAMGGNGVEGAGAMVQQRQEQFHSLRRIGANIVGAGPGAQGKEQKKLNLAERNAKAAEDTREILASHLPKLADRNGRF